MKEMAQIKEIGGEISFEGSLYQTDARLLESAAVSLEGIVQGSKMMLFENFQPDGTRVMHSIHISHPPPLFKPNLAQKCSKYDQRLF
jgi:hypothetical protein